MGRRRTPCCDQWSLVRLDELCGGICHKKGGTLSEMSISDVCLLECLALRGLAWYPERLKQEEWRDGYGAFSFYAVQ